VRVIFAGTPEFAACALEALYSAGFDIPLVLTQPDRPAGRGMQMHASAVKQSALRLGIPVAQPISLRLDGKYPDDAAHAHQLLHSTPHDVMVVAAYGLILPPSVLTIPAHGCLNIHASLLPRWRGAAPIHRAIEAGDEQTGITIMQMEQGLDTGPMLAVQALQIAPQDTSATLHDKLAALGAEMIVQSLRQLEQGQSFNPMVQPEQGVNYAAKISKDEAQLDFNLSAQVLHRKIRAFNPFPIAQAKLDGTVIKIARAELVRIGQVSAASGEILAANSSEGVVVACEQGKSVLRLTELQKPGGKRLSAPDFLLGFPMQVGQRFSL
jgi:methionyl-tRNA formyltransferase